MPGSSVGEDEVVEDERSRTRRSGSVLVSFVFDFDVLVVSCVSGVVLP